MKKFLFYLKIALTLAALVLFGGAVYAADPLETIGNLSDFIFSAIRAIGVILLGWGVVQIGMSLQSHDPSQRTNGFLTFFGGLVIAFAKEILTLIGVV
jgi:hypothetical protein